MTKNDEQTFCAAFKNLSPIRPFDNNRNNNSKQPSANADESRQKLFTSTGRNKQSLNRYYKRKQNQYFWIFGA